MWVIVRLRRVLRRRVTVEGTWNSRLTRPGAAYTGRYVEAEAKQQGG